MLFAQLLLLFLLTLIFTWISNRERIYKCDPIFILITFTTPNSINSTTTTTIKCEVQHKP